MTENRHQRIAREMRERDAAREERRLAELRRSRPRRRKATPFRRTEDEREANRLDGYDRDDLGESPDY